MSDKQQLTIIKGTRDGLTLFIDDTCSFDAALFELRNKMEESSPKNDEPIVPVTVQLGNRYLLREEKDQLKQIVGEKNRFTIDSFESNVVLKEEALRWREESDVKIVNKIVRSGQVLDVKGDILLIGDVNPGGKVVATGNIYIMGNLRGIAHAGKDGDTMAVIVASYMKPNQLRIADYISRAPDYESDGVFLECGLIDEEQDKIIIDRLQVLAHKRKDLDRFERRMQNG